MAEMPTGVNCPACDKHELTYRSTEFDIPYFGKATQTTLLCAECGYKHNDIMLNQLNEPLRYSFTIEKEEDMSVKVVRSASGTVSVPELGLLVEPGIASEGYISNVEGVFVRFRDVVEQAIRFAVGTEDEKEAKTKGNEILKHIGEVIDGKRSVTLVIADPFGNSAIISDRVVKEPIPEEEAEKLQSGFNIFEIVK
jgi:zinc finger protein